MLERPRRNRSKADRSATPIPAPSASRTLAPDIVTDILNGRPKADLTLRSLTKSFSVRWDDQMRWLI
jgi:hypothetical protein